MTVRRASGVVAGVLAALIASCTLLALTGCAAAGTREISGDLVAHDPALVAGEGDEPWFVYSTGDPLVDHGELQIRRSDDGGATWSYAGPTWDERPSWIAAEVPGVVNLWAPDLVEHDGTWYLYYSASTFGSNHSTIALATNTTLDPRDPAFDWVDRGPVLISTTSGDFNAIDPGIVADADGDPWMAFGSFWSGIRMVPLEWPSGLRADKTAPDATVAGSDDSPLYLAGGREGPNAIEAPTVVEHDGSYFLFVSIGACCSGVDSTYQIAVGRAERVTGPYLDQKGTPMLEGGGTILLSTAGDRIGPGGESASRRDDGSIFMGFHFYDGAEGGRPHLAINQIEWDAAGWPSFSW